MSTWTSAALDLIAIPLRLAGWRPVTIRERWVGLHVVRGRLRGELQPGRHWVRFSHEVLLADLRERLLTVAGQEVSTADGAPVKLSLAVAWEIGDAATALIETADVLERLRAVAQLALRERASSVALPELLARRTCLDDTLTTAVREEAHALGVLVRSARLKDVSLGAELERAFGEAARARAQAAAELERARGESAALRCLTNAARLVREHRGLYELRLLDTARAAGTLALGLSGAALAERIDTGAAPAAAVESGAATARAGE